MHVFIRFTINKMFTYALHYKCASFYEWICIIGKLRLWRLDLLFMCRQRVCAILFNSLRYFTDNSVILTYPCCASFSKYNYSPWWLSTWFHAVWRILLCSFTNKSVMGRGFGKSWLYDVVLAKFILHLYFVWFCFHTFTLYNL